MGKFQLCWIHSVILFTRSLLLLSPTWEAKKWVNRNEETHGRRKAKMEKSGSTFADIFINPLGNWGNPMFLMRVYRLYIPRCRRRRPPPPPNLSGSFINKPRRRDSFILFTLSGRQWVRHESRFSCISFSFGGTQCHAAVPTKNFMRKVRDKNLCYSVCLETIKKGVERSVPPLERSRDWKLILP